jgi:hypothetical protein
MHNQGIGAVTTEQRGNPLDKLIYKIWSLKCRLFAALVDLPTFALPIFA